MVTITTRQIEEFIKYEATIMTLERSESLVSVYSTPLKFDADFVKSMLADESIPSSVENSSAPFPGISASPCEVFVAAEHESAARRIIEEFETRRQQSSLDEQVEGDDDELNPPTKPL